MSFICTLSATNDWVLNLTNHNWIVSAYTTSTNLVIKHPSSGGKLMARYDRWDYTINTYIHGFDYNDEYYISTNRVTKMFNGWAGVSYTFTPVLFTNQMTGFQIQHIDTLSGEFDDTLIMETNTWYVALSETLVEVGEGDVERELLAENDD